MARVRPVQRRKRPASRAWLTPLLIFSVAVAVRMALSLRLGIYTDLTRYEMERAALSLAHSGRLADPYLIPTGYTAHVSPGYALILAAIFKLFGTGYTAELIKNLVSSSAVAALYALMPAAAESFGISRLAALAAAWFGAILPLRPNTEIMGDWEAPFTALALLLLAWAASEAWRNRAFSLRRGALLGLGWGAALLISPALLPVLLGVLLVGYFVAGRDSGRRYAAHAVVTLAMAAVCLAPWAWRNERALGAPIFTRSNFGLEMHMSNNSLASPLEAVNLKIGVYDRLHPFRNLQEAEAVREMGEVAYNRSRLHLAEAWIRSHPRRFLVLTAERILYTWFPRTGMEAVSLALWCMTIASLLGLAALWRTERAGAALWRTERAGAALLTACLAAYTPIYYLIQVSVRYRYPIDWILLLTAASFAVSLARRFVFQPAAARHAAVELPLNSHAFSD